jgi:hypothetical protein
MNEPSANFVQRIVNAIGDAVAAAAAVAVERSDV